MINVVRGGVEMTIPLNVTHHIPPRLLGQLDEEGILICDQMLCQGYTVLEIVEYFKTYVPVKERIALKFKQFKELTEKLKCGDVTDSEKMRMLKDIIDGQNLSQKDFLDLMQTQFGDKAKAEMEEMLKSGMSMEEVLEHFQRQAEKEELKGKLQALLEDQNASTEEVFEAMRSQLGSEDQAKIDEMLKSGLTMEQILNHFMNGGMDEGSKNDIPTVEEVNKMMRDQLKSQIANLLNDPNATTEQVFNSLLQSLGKDEQGKIDEMLKLGMTMEEIIKHFVSGDMDDKDGKEAKQKAKDELKSKIKDLLNDPNASTEEVFNALRSQLNMEDQEKIDAMLKDGMTMDQIINHFMKGGMDEKKVESDLTRKLKELVGGKNLTEEEMFELMKSQLGEGSKAELEAMLAQGISLQEVMDHFMTKDKTEEEKLQTKMKNMLNDPNTSTEDVFNMLRGQLGAEDKAKIDELLNSGMSMEEIIRQFTAGGIENVKNQQKNSDLSKKISELIGGKNLSSEEKLKLFKDQLGPQSKAELEEMLSKGYTMEEAMDYMMRHGKTKDQEEKEEKDLQSRLQNMINNPDKSTEDVFESLRSQLSSKEQARIDELIRSGMSMEEVVKKFLEGGIENVQAESEISRKLKELTGGQNLSQEEMFELLKSKLGDESKAELEAMLAAGYTMDEAMQHMLKHGKTADEEHQILANKISDAMNGKNMTKDEKLNFLKNNLSSEARAAMEDLLAQGYTADEIIELFRKHGNNLDAIDAELTNPSVNFEEEPSDAHLHANRDVFSVIDRLVAWGYIYKKDTIFYDHKYRNYLKKKKRFCCCFAVLRIFFS